MAATLLQEISRDERERAIHRSRKMAETDLASNLLTAEARGEMRGERRGVLKGELERKKLQNIIVSKDAEIASMEAEIARLRGEK